MKSLIKDFITTNEKDEIYQIGKTYYFEKGIGPNKKEWEFLTTLPYHQKIGKQFQIIKNKNILGYTISTKPSKINEELWSKVMEGGISNYSTKKLKDFIQMFDFLKKQNANLLIEVGTKEEKMYSILTNYCDFKSFQNFEEQEATQIMKFLLNQDKFELSKDENDHLLVNRETRQIKNYQGNLIYWSQTKS